MKKLYIVVPSRGGRESLQEMIDSWEASRDESELIIVIDQDERDKYKPLFAYPTVGINVVVLNKRYYLAPKLNIVAQGIIRGDFGVKALGVGYIGDDCLFRTDGWEERIITQLERQRGLVYCNDLLQKEFLPNNIFIHSNIIEALGFMCPRVLNHYYIDNYWKDLGLRTNLIRYFPEIVIEHMHWKEGKATKDALHKEMEKFIKLDHANYDQYVLQGNLAADAEKILKSRESNE